MIKSNVWAKISGLGIFYRWHPAIALRYLPIAERINKMDDARKILEVGSGGLGIAPYLKREVTGVDNNFEPPYHPLLRRVNGSALKLPFGDDSFDIAISVDMLEHLQKEERQVAINELLRTAEKGVFIGVPCGKESEKEDRVLHNYYREKVGREFKFLAEQTAEKLPTRELMVKMVKRGAKQAKKEIVVKIRGNENIILHRFLMRGWMTDNFFVNVFFRKILLLLIPILRILDRPPYYRQLFFVQII